MPEVVKFLAGIENEFELGEEHVGMEADAPVEIDQVAVDVIEDLERRALFGEEDRQPAGEWLDIASMRRNQREDLAEKPGLSAGPNDGGLNTTSGDQIMIVRSGREE